MLIEEGRVFENENVRHPDHEEQERQHQLSGVPGCMFSGEIGSPLLGPRRLSGAPSTPVATSVQSEPSAFFRSSAFMTGTNSTVAFAS